MPLSQLRLPKAVSGPAAALTSLHLKNFKSWTDHRPRQPGTGNAGAGLSLSVCYGETSFIATMNQATINEDKGSVVYVLTNPAMPGMVKIGMTAREDITQRFTDLYTTGVPLPFECAYAAKVANAGEVEKAFHTAFGPYRVNPKREFFEIEPEQVRVLLKLKQIGLEDMTPTVKEEAEQVDRGAKASAEKLKRSRRRPNMHFQDMGIPVDSRLDFTEGDHHCTVVDERKVEYDGSEWYLSALTKRLLGVDRPIRGLVYWRFDGRDLADIYEDAYASDM